MVRTAADPRREEKQGRHGSGHRCAEISSRQPGRVGRRSVVRHRGLRGGPVRLAQRGFELFHLGRELGLFRLELVDLVAKLGLDLFRARPDLVKRFPDSAADAAILFAIEAPRECSSALGIPHLDQGTHHIDAQVRVGVLEELLEGLAVLAIGGQPRESHDGGPASAGLGSITGARQHVCNRALVAQGGESVERPHAEDVRPRRSIEDLDERFVGGRLARLSEGSRRFRLHEVAPVPEGNRFQLLRCFRRLEVPDGLHYRTPHLGVLGLRWDRRI